jgi:hypothetical protein
VSTRSRASVILVTLITNQCRYALIDTDGSRILLGDGFGKLSILSLTRSTSETTLSLVRLGEVRFP